MGSRATFTYAVRLLPGVLCAALILTVSPLALGAEVDEASVPASGGGFLDSASANVFVQLQELGKTMGQVAQVTTVQASAGTTPASAGASASSASGGPSDTSASGNPKSSVSLGEKDGGVAVLPVKNIAKSDRVGERDGDSVDQPKGPVASVYQSSTATLELSGLGNVGSVMNTLDDIGRRRAANIAASNSLSTFSGVVAQAQARNKPAFGGPGGGDKDSDKKKKGPDEGTSPLTNSGDKATFGNAGDLTLNNIASNNRANNGKDKDGNDKDKDKEKDKKDKEKDPKKKEEEQKLQKEAEDIIKRDPFKFEDYAELRDLFANKGNKVGELLENDPQLGKIKDKILNDFSGRDASPPSIKSPLLDFLNDSTRSEGFQNPIVVEPKIPRHSGEPSH